MQKRHLEASKTVEVEKKQTVHLPRSGPEPAAGYVLAAADAAVQFPPEAAQKQDSLLTCLTKGKKEVPPMEKPLVVKIHLRNMVILPEMGSVVGSMVGTHDGKTFKQVGTKLQVSSVSITYEPVKHSWPGTHSSYFSPPRSCGQKTHVQSPKKTKSKYNQK
ncbi:hypothetical protein U0070_021937 [Myodes glareolus]|uniref:40S ribosomal protein S15 n=1 Tax=Myodes glareolus TaxID=447135 RepID=A0AAW0HX02_MYOGA